MRKDTVWLDPSKTRIAPAAKDVPYASKSEAQKLDVYLPAHTDRLVPVIAWFHPGGFFQGDKDGSGMDYPVDNVDMTRLVGPMLERGYAAVSVNYRLSQEALFPAVMHDAKASIRWIRASAAKYGFNPGKIAVWGSSSGGHIAAMLAVSGGVAGLEDLSLGNAGESSRICAAVDWYGPSDFLLMDAHHRELGQPPRNDDAASPESRLIGGAVPLYPERCKAASPITYVSPETVPIYIQHGKKDPYVPYLQSVVLADALERVIGPEKVILEVVANVGHGDPLFFAPENVNSMLDFLDPFLR